jgi:hypothetical protein
MTVMSPRSARRMARAAVLPAAVLAVAGLAGCKGTAVAVSTTGSSPAAAVASADAATGAATAEPAATVAAEPAATTADTAPPSQGSVTASISSPVMDSGTVKVPVSCASGLAYRATVTSAVVHGDQVSFSVVIPRYRGPGSYPAVVGATLRQSSGVVTAVAGVSRVPAVITSTGGSFSVSATGSGGRTLTSSLSWTCGS